MNFGFTEEQDLLRSEARKFLDAQAPMGEVRRVAETPAGHAPVINITISADDQHLWVDTFMDGKTRLFDISDPFNPKQVYEREIGKQINMVSQSWDGNRIYFTSSLLANWDKKGENDDQFLRAFNWDGKELTPVFEIDFYEEKLGRAHHMKFGSDALKAAYVDSEKLAARR